MTVRISSYPSFYQPRCDVVKAWGDWISTLAEWEWFATLTLRENSPESIARGWTRPGWATAKRMWSKFVEESALLRDSLKWVRVIEIQQWRGVPHIHALVAGADTGIGAIRDWSWREHGFNRILEYVPEKGANYYVCKYIVKDLQDIEFSPGLRAEKRG